MAVVVVAPLVVVEAAMTVEAEQKKRDMGELLGAAAADSGLPLVPMLSTTLL